MSQTWLNSVVSATFLFSLTCFLLHFLFLKYQSFKSKQPLNLLQSKETQLKTKAKALIQTIPASYLWLNQNKHHIKYYRPINFKLKKIRFWLDKPRTHIMGISNINNNQENERVLVVTEEVWSNRLLCLLFCSYEFFINSSTKLA